MEQTVKENLRNNKAFTFGVSTYGFIKNLLVISIGSFLIRILYDLFFIQYNPYGYNEATEIIETKLIVLGMLTEYIVLFLFFTIKLLECRDRCCRLIIKIWLISYLATTILWVLFVDLIMYLSFPEDANSSSFMDFADRLPEMYTSFSAVMIAIAIYHTGKVLASSALKLAGVLYLPSTIGFLLAGRVFLTEDWHSTLRVDIVSYIYYLQYILWLFYIRIHIRREYGVGT